MTRSSVPSYRAPRPRRVIRPADLTSYTIDPRVMREALRLANGEPRRLEFFPDGSVLVHNRPR